MATDHGFLWSDHATNVYGSSSTHTVSLGAFDTGKRFKSFVSDLPSEKKLFVRAFIKTEDDVFYSNEITFYTPGGSWRRMKDFPGKATVNGQAFVVNNKAYILSGKELWMYDPAINEWEQKLVEQKKCHYIIIDNNEREKTLLRKMGIDPNIREKQRVLYGNTPVVYLDRSFKKNFLYGHRRAKQKRKAQSEPYGIAC